MKWQDLKMDISLDTLGKYLDYCNQKELNGSARSVCQYMVEAFPNEREKVKEIIHNKLYDCKSFADRMTFEVDLFCEMQQDSLLHDDDIQEMKELLTFFKEFLPFLYTLCFEIIKNELGEEFLNDNNI